MIERNSGQLFIRLIPREIALGYYGPHVTYPIGDHEATEQRGCFEGSGDRTQRRRAMLLTRARGLSTRFNCKYLDRLRDVLQLLWTEVPKTESELSVDLIINEP